MSLRRTLQIWLGSIGLYLTQQEPYDLAWQLRRVFSALHINCVIDVGAHYGEYGSFIRRVIDYHGRLVSFEPVSSSYGELSKTADSDPEWITHNVALGAVPDVATINVFNRSDFNSILAPTGHDAEHFGLVTQKSEQVSV